MPTLKFNEIGKGTISNWIVRDFGLTHVSSGDLLRANLRYNMSILIFSWVIMSDPEGTAPHLVLRQKHTWPKGTWFLTL